LPDFRHEDETVASYITEVSAAWVERFAIDGIRMDTAKHVPRAYFADWFFPRLREIRPDLFVVAEVFDAGSAAVYREYLDAGFDSTFHFALRQGLIDVFARDASTNVLADRVKESITSLGLERALRMTPFLDNHDVPRWSEEVPGSVAANDKLHRYRLALGALFTIPGIPQLYYGDELGFTGTWPVNRRDMPSWAWSAADRAGDHPDTLPDAAGTFEYVKRLSTIRRESSALWRGYYAELWRQNAGAPVYAFFRGDGDSRVIVVIHNGDSEVEVSFRVSDAPDVKDADRAALADGVVLTELLGAGAPSSAQITGGRVTMMMPARSMGIYRVP
jgi:glycosidase